MLQYTVCWLGCTLILSLYPVYWWSGGLRTESANRWRPLRRWALFGITVQWILPRLCTSEWYWTCPRRRLQDKTRLDVSRFLWAVSCWMHGHVWNITTCFQYVVMYELVYTEIPYPLWLLCVLGTIVVVSVAPEADCIVTVTDFHTCPSYPCPSYPCTSYPCPSYPCTLYPCV